MTTEVKIKACCSDDTEVVVECESEFSGYTKVLRNGEEHSDCVYDDREIKVYERPVTKVKE